MGLGSLLRTFVRNANAGLCTYLPDWNECRLMGTGRALLNAGTQVQRLLAATSYTLMTNLNKLFTFVLVQVGQSPCSCVLPILPLCDCGLPVQLVEQKPLERNAWVGVTVSFSGGFLYSYLSAVRLLRALV
jgi:hypothetical protein